MTQVVNLAELMRKIDEKYRFSGDAYPALQMNSAEKQYYFGIAHSNLHMQKAQGTIATELEEADHGGVMSLATLRTATSKQLVNVLKLASHLGLSAEELAEFVEKAYK